MEEISAKSVAGDSVNRKRESFKNIDIFTNVSNNIMRRKKLSFFDEEIDVSNPKRLGSSKKAPKESFITSMLAGRKRVYSLKSILIPAGRQGETKPITQIIEDFKK